MFRCYAATSFGLESEAKYELIKLGANNISVNDARCYFDADEEMILRANMSMRVADRIYIEIKRFKAFSFEELFEGINLIKWEEFIPKNAAFPVAADSVKSKLKSVSDIQSISKKAIVERLKKAYKVNYLDENAEKYRIYISILKDEVSVCLNTSGEGLNRRGYRKYQTAAPMRETLAAGMLYLSRYKGNCDLYDPMCGSGTIAIEAALISKNIIPARFRKYDVCSWRWFNASFDKALKEFEIKKPSTIIYASDIDEGAIKAARINAKAAGVDDIIRFKKADITRTSFLDFHGIIAANPPYAIRLGEEKETRMLYGKMGEALLKATDADKNIICADDDFERYFKKRADAKRKLYNGNIRCTLFRYMHK